MRNRVAIWLLVGLAVLSLVLIAVHRPGPDPKDLFCWLKVGANQDWTKAASNGQAEAEFHLGLNMVQSNLLFMVDRVPRLSGVPIIGKRFFEHRSYAIDNRISQEQLTEAYRWLRKAADQGYPPAVEAVKLFAGRVPGERQ
jgi:TPR repeat protein